MSRRPPLIVYDEQETLFETNGLRLLSPTLAEHTIEMNQAGSIYIEHPLDSDGDWQSLIPGHIILAPVPYRNTIRLQPFRIYRRQKKRVDGTPFVAVDAMHMFYDLNYVVLDDVRPTNLSCQAAIQWLFDHAYNPSGSSVLPLSNFTFASDIATTATSYFEWKTMTGALIGEDNSILNRWGGELFVNGLYFSIKSTMEESQQNAFQIIYRQNLQEVEETIDYTNTFSQLAATDNFGNSKYQRIALSQSGLPFEKTLYAKFSYSDDLGEAGNLARFNADFAAYLESIQEVEVSYSVKYADLPVGSEFSGLSTYEVGDTGTITDSELGISTTQRITKTVTDLLTGERISTETGNVQRSIARKSAWSNTVTTTESAAQKQADALAESVSKMSADRLRTWGTAYAGGMTWAEAANYKWEDAGT